MEHPDLIPRTADHVKAKLSGEGSGHDWWHIYRVWKTAQRIGQAEGADLLIVELAALLHDIADWKAHGGDSTVGPQAARDWLVSLGREREVVEHVCRDHRRHLVQGSRRGAARTLAGRQGRPGRRPAGRHRGHRDCPSVRLRRCQGAADPRSRDEARGASHRRSVHQEHRHDVNHFYEKLLLLKDRMNTATGRAIAVKRHQFMEEFLRRFCEEWDGESPI